MTINSTQGGGGPALIWEGGGRGPFRLEMDKIVIRVHRFTIAARVAELQREQTAKARYRLAMFSRCHEALTLVTFAELQAQNCTSYYRKRGSASYIVREVLLVREREREREREKER